MATVSEPSKILTDDVLDFLSGVAAVEFAQKFVKKYKLSDASVGAIMNLAEDVTRSDIALEQLPAELMKQFKLSEAVSKQAAIEMAEERLLPVQQVIGDVRGQIQKWGGDLSMIPEAQAKTVSPESFTHSFVLSLPGDMPSHLESRLEHFLLSYLIKHSNRAEIVEDMMRAEKVGGLAFEEKDAGSLLDYFDEKKANVKFEKEIGGVSLVGDGRDRPAQSVPNKIVKPIELLAIDPSPVKISPPLQGGDKGVVVPSSVPREEKREILPVVRMTQKPDAFSETDEKEIEEIKVQKQSALEKPLNTPATIEDMVANVCSIDSMRFTDQKLGDRCKQIVESRLREVRTASDTQNLLERSVEAGGLGVTGRKLSDMMQSIERGVDEFQTVFAKKVENERKEFVEGQVTRDLAKQSLAEKEEKAMTKRYVEMTGKIPDAHIQAASPSGSRVSGAVSAGQALQAREEKIDTAKVRSAIESAKPSLPPPLQGGVGGGHAVARPDMSDVRFIKRLSGPIDELRSMSLIDFRRLSNNTTDAAEKIKGQVDLVENQGYEKKVEAIRAWQSSPLYQMYLKIARAAMQEGVPLEEARLAQEKTSESLLTKEELSAILKLNSELRF